MSALNARDAYTENHCRRVVQFAMALGEHCSLSLKELEILQASSLLHDVGKIGIPDSVLLKPGRLTPEEWELMKTHPVIGERIISGIPLPDMNQVATIVRHHHENFNGLGYPDGLVGEDIPVMARILALADSYDAMASTRVYQKQRSHPDIMLILEEESGERYDPYLLRHFKGLVDDPDLRHLWSWRFDQENRAAET